MSVAGGLPRAVERGVIHGCQSLQIFSKNASQWRGRVVPPAEIRAFRKAVTASGITPVYSHASYLINLATASPALRRQSMLAMADELDRAEALRLDGVVLHPGCYTVGSREHGLALVAESLSAILKQRPRGRTMVLIEHTAGQGTSLGASFGEIAAIIEAMKHNRRVGVCLDTCHLVASGYDISSADGYAATFDEFERLVGFDRLKAFHLNDSKRPAGSRVDRHTHIGEGFVGLEGFRRLVNDPRFRDLPMLLETPKTAAAGKSNGPVVVDPLDAENLRRLRALVSGP